MAFDEGFDFRSTSGAASDPANCQWVTQTDTYPKTANGVTFGWEDAPTGTLDDTAGGVEVLKGLSYAQTTTRFRVDLANTMTADIKVGAGYQGAQEPQSVEMVDTTTSLWTASATTLATQYMDANSTVHTSAANWSSNNTTKSATFSTTIARMKIGAAGAYTTINHLRITEQSGAAFVQLPGRLVRQAVNRAGTY